MVYVPVSNTGYSTQEGEKNASPQGTLTDGSRLISPFFPPFETQHSHKGSRLMDELDLNPARGLHINDLKNLTYSEHAELNFSVAALIQERISYGINTNSSECVPVTNQSAHSKRKRTDNYHAPAHVDITLFNYSFSDLPGEFGGPTTNISEKMLEHESRLNSVLRGHLESDKIPVINTLLKFTSYTQSRCKFSTQVLIIAGLYMSRLSQVTNFSLTADNWRSLWLACVTIAMQRYDPARALLTTHFLSIAFPVLSENQLTVWEEAVKQMLDHHLEVLQNDYVQLIFELR